MTKPATIEDVVKGGFCVGCGACAYSAKTNMLINEYGEYQPDLDALKEKGEQALEHACFVCPSLTPEWNEDRIANKLYASDDIYKSKFIGYYQEIFGGFVKEGNYRNNGTSGGFGTWIGAELFKRNLIDGVIHVKENTRETSSDPFFKYAISTSLNAIKSGARTKYHVIELSEVLTLIEEKPARYLLIGVPCMIKAIRRIQLQHPIIRESIQYTAALVCGHLKSINWTLSLAWGKGITPEEATGFKYRTKGQGISARAYVFTAYSNNQEIIENSSNVVGGKFNQGALMLNACNFCDDVVGETADISIGDAWLPQFEVDSGGTNLLIVRNKKIQEILQDSLSNDKISIVRLTEDQAKDAQAGGFRQRRDGLSYRLNKLKNKNKWHPKKRIAANSFKIAPLRKIIYSMRYKVTVQSREVFKNALHANDYSLYRKRMYTLLKILRLLEISSSAPRIIRKKIAYLKLR